MIRLLGARVICLQVTFVGRHRDASAKQAARALVVELGFEPMDAGPLARARLLEPFALLWITLAFTPGHGREFAFQLLKRDSGAA